MAEPSHTREYVRAQVDGARAALHELLATTSESDLRAVAVTPEWNGVDMLRHILAWSELACASLKEWPDGPVPAFDDEDQFNAEQLALRSGLAVGEVARRLEAAYEQFAADLDQRSDAELGLEGMTPWHERVSRLRAISGIAWHDGFHIGNIRDALHPKQD
jgi:hypothetical protein